MDNQANIDNHSINCGYWYVNDYGWIVCSCCKEELPYVITQRTTWDIPYSRKDYIDKTKYCPNCGAKMDSINE